MQQSYDMLAASVVGLITPGVYKLANGETVIVRPSGTEPKIKVYYTTLGKDLAEAEAEKEKLAEALKPILA